VPDRQVHVTFQPSGQEVSVLPRTTVLEAAALAGLPIDTPCGGSGTCGKCRVRIAGGTGEPTEVDRELLTTEELAEGWRLACQTAIRSDTVVYVPSSSLFADQHRILETAMTSTAPEILPAVRKVFLEMSPPSLSDGTSDLTRLQGPLGPLTVDLPLLRALPKKLRDGGFSGTAVLSDHRLIDFEPGDTSMRCYGIALDIGTTTLVGSLLNLITGEEEAVLARVNPQVGFGDDVLSRIGHADTKPDGLQQLNQAILAALAEMIEGLCTRARIRPDQVYNAALAGNTTMEHILCRVNPSQLGQSPFVPVHADGLKVRAGELGLPIHERANAYVFPVIGAFVGGDTVSGMLATQLAAQDDPALMVDIGTNGEIVLVHEGRLYAASTAAGPAFEGARISCGMRAAAGAIEKATIDGDLQVSVIGNGRPTGLCGSGLIDVAAGLLSHGIVSPQGRLLPPAELPPGLPSALTDRVTFGSDGKPEFLLSPGPGQLSPSSPRSAGPNSDGVHRPIALTQQDIRELQLASGAIRSGIKLLVKRAGIRTRDLKSILLAGGFGNFIRRSNAQRIGLLPTDVEHRHIRYVGNVSLMGAKWAILSTEARQQAERLARQTQLVELSTEGDFRTEFAEAMIFPSDVD